MSCSKFAAVFRYRFFDNLRGVATMIGILILVMALLLVLSAVPGGFVSGAFTAEETGDAVSFSAGTG